MDTDGKTQCEQIRFVFALFNNGDIVRILLVKAPNDFAVQTIERIVAEDNKACPNCVLLAVHRGGSYTKIESTLATEVSYIDFIMDIVEPGRLIADQTISVIFDQSLTDEDRQYAAIKMKALENQNDPEPETPSEPRPKREWESYPIPPRPSRDCIEDVEPCVESLPQVSDNYRLMEGALNGLGYKKPQIKAIMAVMGPKLSDMKLDDAIREALQLKV